MASHIWQITDGWFALALVDKTAPSYTDAWQAPGGKTVDVVALTDYTSDNPGAQGYACVVTDLHLTANPDNTTTDVPATWCAPGETIPTPAATAYVLEGSVLQDADLTTGLNAWSFEQDTREAYVAVGMNVAGSPPTAIGRVVISALAIGGAARDNLTADVSMPFKGKPDVWFGSAKPGRIVTGSGIPAALKPVAITGVTAGSPATLAPANATVPADLAALKADPVIGSSGSKKPTTAWTAGQSLHLGDASEAHWSGTDWVTGKAS